MRVIKFRAWDKEENEMTDFSSLPMYINDMAYPDDRFEFMQYTGLKDTNGVEIYEDDIVECIYPKRNDITHTLLGNVAFIDGCWFITESKRNYCSPLYSEFELMVVIGNIYTHPSSSADNLSDEEIAKKYEQYCMETEEPLSFAKWFGVWG